MLAGATTSRKPEALPANAGLVVYGARMATGVRSRLGGPRIVIRPAAYWQTIRAVAPF